MRSGADSINPACYGNTLDSENGTQAAARSYLGSGSRLLKWMSKSNVAIYRATDGRVGGHKLGLPLYLLSTTGRKGGLSRTTPLIFVADGARVVLVASQGGLPTHPMWFLNLCANSEVHVQIRAETHTMCARVADDAERTQLWPRLIAHNPRWARYQSWTDRLIPVVVCEPGRPSVGRE